MICLVRPHLVGEVTNRPAVLAGRLGTCARLAGTCSRHKKGDKLILESLYIGGSMPVFTDSALWARSVIESPCPYCMYVCMSVIKVVIVNNVQRISFFFVFFHKIE